ncbi:MAG: hypothetical protein OEZ59_02565 [Deltaproteobacteria bacterium]|nr:hypothetical protein [Deltaproteobacteria bacterium]
MENTNTWINESMELLKASGVRSTKIGDEHFVSHSDYTAYIRELVQQIVDVAGQQKEETENVAFMLEVFNDYLAENHPHVLRELQQVMSRKLNAC